MYSTLEKQAPSQYDIPKLTDRILDGNIETFKQNVSDILWWFKTPQDDNVDKDFIHRKNKEKTFYAHIVQDLYFQDLETVPNDRKNYVYKYLRRFLIPIIKQGTKDIYHGREEKTQVEIDEFWISENKMNNDGIVKNEAYAADYIDEKTWELNEKFSSKLSEYYGIYETVVVKRIQYELHSNNIEKLDEENLRNLLINIANEFTFILKAFSDKLTVWEFEKIFLRKDSSNDAEWIIWISKSINAIYDDFRYSKKHVEELIPLSKKQEKKLNPEQKIKREQLKKQIDTKKKIEDEEERRHNDLLEMYKSFIPTALVLDASTVHFNHAKLAENIEKHFEDSFLDIADIFKHWLYSEDMTLDWLEKIRVMLYRFYDNFKTLKQKDKAFSHISLKDFRSHLLNKKKTDNVQVTDILSQEYEYESFQKLCYLMDWVEIESWLSIDKKKIIYKQERNNRLNLLCHEIQIQKQEQNKHIEFIDITQTPLEDLDFDLFNQAWPVNRKKYFLDKVYIRDREKNIIWHNFDKAVDETWEDSEELINFAIYYSEKHKSYKTQEDKVISDLKLVLDQLKSSKINTYKFQENNIYYEQLLVSWFRYNLALKKYWKTNEKIAKILNEEMYGPKELLLNDYWQEISSSNISFRNGWSENKLHNTSIWNIDELIEKYELRFNKRPINLNDEENFSVKNKQERWVKNILMKDISSLYLPNIENWEILKYQDIKNYLNWIEDFSIWLLQRRNLKDTKYDIYRSVFENYWIDANDFDQIWKIRKFLKYAQYILPIAHELSKKSLAEQEAINELYKIVWNDMVTDETYKFEVWEPKDLKRIFEKIIWSYSWDIREMWDLARMRYVWENMDDCYKKMNTMIRSIKTNPKLNNYIVQWIVEDSVWNNSERWPKKTQYRDLKLQFKNDKWILIEVQFIVKEMFEWKEEWLPEDELNEIMIHQNLDLWQDFIDELERRADAEWILIPQFLLTIFEADVTIHKDKFKKYDTKINSDLFYKLHRWSWNKHFKMIMAHLESVVYDRQRWKVIAKQSRKLDEQEEISA